jgi:hypothetical protein
MALEFGKFFRTAMLAKMINSDQVYKEVELKGCFELALEAYEMWKKWPAEETHLKDAEVVKFNQKVGLE